MSTVPAIPVSLRHVPTVGGLVVPYVTARAFDGRYLFGTLDASRQRECLVEHRCQVCARRLQRPLVLFMRLADLPDKSTTEPALHPVCAAYTQAACPMVAGRQSHYRATPVRVAAGLDAPVDSPARLGAPAEPWFAVWLTIYTADYDEHRRRHLASYAGVRPLRIRPITWRLPTLW